MVHEIYQSWKQNESSWHIYDSSVFIMYSTILFAFSWLAIKLLKIFPIQKWSIVIKGPNNHIQPSGLFLVWCNFFFEVKNHLFKLAYRLFLPVFKHYKLIAEPICIWSICFQWLKIYTAWYPGHIVVTLYFLTKLKKKLSLMSVQLVDA